MVVVTVSWAVVSWAVLSGAVVSWAVLSWAVVSWDVVSSWAAVGACNTPWLSVGSNSVVVAYARVHIRLRLLCPLLTVPCCAPSFWIASRVHMGSGVGFVSHSLCGAFITFVPGVVAVRPKIFGGFISPEVFRDVPADESAGAVGAPCCLVDSSVPVYAGITAALAALVFISGVIITLLR